MKPAEPTPGTLTNRREWAFVAAMTAFGLGVRAWGLGRLGLVHFDEGIYAIAGLWPLGPGGIDPLVVPYAPAGFPLLVGLAYTILGPSDVAAILVSVATGTLAIPAAAWLARRTFGPGAGATVAALVAASGFHVAFSRMALTDATFVLCWLVGLVLGQRFLERPGAVTSILLGAATGVAQLVKYSGWTLGVAVMITAATITALDSSRRTASYQRRVWGWGSLAAVVAALAYAPWFAFVESHGGYAALMAHHRGYVGSVGSWLPHWAHQLEQMSILSGGFAWNLAACILTVAGVALVRGRVRTSRRAWLGIASLAAAAVAAPTVLWWVGLARLVFLGNGASPGLRLLGVAWVGLSILTPFYHPYARLWLPIQALGWVATAGLLASLIEPGMSAMTELRWNRVPLAVACCGAALSQSLIASSVPIGAEASPGILAPSDSLRLATARLLKSLPEGKTGLRALVRPPFTFYYARGGGGVRVEGDLEGLLKNDDGSWVLVDLAQLRQSGDVARLQERWETRATFPTWLNLPTRLDVDPGATAGARPEEADAPLWLMVPRGTGDPR
ncbi:glycosyltransferase family 39 protein [Paludisphaera mucosa]|uniref:Glycosyltransferase family 39 protein n=1 Tax=Paludisphaera mucosa TaxID=3030827 RepID=A0ABT6FHE5_9BACT|nr:glycosyltransferase family 39 protein [Paludisphaera mucosa]MDG3006965.1 glycosyltransferase family 39 protein [Paludisphaera mucosa]